MPGSDPGSILVHFSSLPEAADAVDRTWQSIQGQYDDLQRSIAPLVATWSSQAASNYHAHQQRWNSAAADLSELLRRIAQALRSSHDNYVRAERANTAMWT